MDLYLTFILCCVYSIDYVSGRPKLIEDDWFFDPVELILDEHNKYRKMHGAPALELDQYLSSSAQEWSNHLASLGANAYRPFSDFGQNLWHRSNITISNLMSSDDTNPVKIWYDQCNHYPGYYDPEQIQYTGAFTQVVWVSTRKLGVGISHGYNKLFVVCFYQPPGNELASSYEDTVYNYRKNVLNENASTWFTPAPLSYFCILAFMSIFTIVVKLAREYRRLNLF